MKIGGLQKLTLIDYPQKPACTVFLAGCNFRCPWCHSPGLVLPKQIEKTPEMEEEYFFEFLKKRKKVLEGVVVCGGEPTIHKELPQFIRKIKKIGYPVKLDTNGSNPHILKELLEESLLDYIAMDIKAPLKDYKKATAVQIDPQLIKKSIELVKTMEDYEFRTTLVPGIHSKEDLILIAKEIEGAKNYFLQTFRGKITINNNYQEKNSFTKREMEEFKESVKKYVKNCEIR
jgi:pyruvate formate lyase activating enzyme